MPESSELEDLQDLLSDFATTKRFTPEEALKLSHMRYRMLSKELFGDLLDVLNSYIDHFPKFFFGLALNFHLEIFHEIFSNAGEFRKSSDPGGGQVHFGQFDHKSGKTAKFQGSSPKDIEQHLTEICQWLSPKDTVPILTAVRFYQRFVYIHPFYDANGRIGRLLISFYLAYHGYTVLWKPLEEGEKDRFISLLNRCHALVGKPHFDKKARELKGFWENYIICLDELEASDGE